MQNLTYYVVGCNLYFVENNVQLIEMRALLRVSSFIAQTCSKGSILMVKNKFSGNKMLFRDVADMLEYCRSIYPEIQKHSGAIMIEDSCKITEIIKDCGFGK